MTDDINSIKTTVLGISQYSEKLNTLTESLRKTNNSRETIISANMNNLICQFEMIVNNNNSVFASITGGSSNKVKQYENISVSDKVLIETIRNLVLEYLGKKTSRIMEEIQQTTTDFKETF